MNKVDIYLSTARQNKAVDQFIDEVHQGLHDQEIMAAYSAMGYTDDQISRMSDDDLEDLICDIVDSVINKHFIITGSMYDA